MGIRAWTNAFLRRPTAQAIVAALCCVPLALLVGGALSGSLSANPIDDVTDATGRWTLRFILITLAVTPMRALLGLNALAPYRRMTGLVAFFYGSLHLLTYLWFDQFFDWSEIVSDVTKRPFIALGFATFSLMVPLAVSSVRRVSRWMGPGRWKALHRLVYVVAAGGVVHYLWLVKADRTSPLVHGAILTLLLAWRAWNFWRARRANSAAV